MIKKICKELLTFFIFVDCVNTIAFHKFREKDFFFWQSFQNGRIGKQATNKVILLF